MSKNYLDHPMAVVEAHPTLFGFCCSCGAPLVWKIAEAVEKGLRHKLWRCTSCEASR